MTKPAEDESRIALIAQTTQGFTVVIQLTDILTKVCLSDMCSQKYKSHVVQTINKLLTTLQKFSIVNSEPYDQTLGMLTPQVLAGLQQMQ